MGFFGIAIACLMMLYRVQAVCRGDVRIVYFMWLLFLILVFVNIWLITTGGPVPHPGISEGCTMIYGRPYKIGSWASALAWTPLIYDTAVLTFIVLRTRKINHMKVMSQSNLVTVLIRDGIVYYSVIFTINLVLAVMIVQAPDGVKNVCSQLQLM